MFGVTERCGMLATTFLSTCVLLLSLGAQQVSGQTPATARPEDTTAIKLRARLVNLNIKVASDSGKPVPKLNREDFVVLEDNVAQEVTYFEPVTAPVNLVLLLDLSGSIGSQMRAIRKAARKFVESLGKQDRVAIATFTTRFRLPSDFTVDKDLIKERIDHLPKPGAATTFP